MKNFSSIAIVFAAIFVALIGTRLAFTAMQAPLANLGISENLTGIAALLLITSIGTAVVIRERKLRVAA